jgi:aminoglycoside phosphotransferase (APT) family kinase protein
MMLAGESNGKRERQAMKVNRHLTNIELQEYVQHVFGSSYHLTEQTKSQGGAQKAIYKVRCTNGFACMLYVWDISSNYFQEELLHGPTFRSSYGSSLFSMNTNYLQAHGIRTPALYDLNNEGKQHHFDFALVEYIDGQTAEDYFQHTDSISKDRLFQRIGEMISVMHSMERNVYGKVDNIDVKETACSRLKQNDAVKSLLYASRHLQHVKENYNQLLEKLYELEAQIQPRSRYHFIHDELGPNHILVDHQLQPCLIDIEGAGFFDLEHEHSCLALRFGEYYRYFEQKELDPARLSFYQFCHHLSLMAGGLKLLHRQFPDQQFARNLAAYHAKHAVEML